MTEEDTVRTTPICRLVVSRSGPSREYRCKHHGGVWDDLYGCPTQRVLADVAAERQRQHSLYGTNDTLVDGTGPNARWLVGASDRHAYQLEQVLRQDYEAHEARTGAPTWMHVLREEVAEAFQESDPARLREELVQVAAVAVSWAEKLDAKAGL